MKMNCAFSCDDVYVQHAAVGMVSIFENNKEIEEIDVYFIENSISDKYKMRLNEIAERYCEDGIRNIIFVPLDKITSTIQVDTGFCRSTYGKLFMSQFKNVDRMLCFDCDVVCTGSLKELLEMDLKDATVWGVQDTVNPYFRQAIGLTNHDRYINCGGVIVIDLVKWRQLGLEQQFIHYIEEWNGNPPFVDQGTINKFCKTAILNPKYNVINPMLMFPVKKLKKLFKMEKYYTQKEIDEAIENPIIIHFTGELYNRPWCKECTHPLKDVYLEYLSKTPWAGKVIDKALSKNCKIQNWVYYHCPFIIYLLMIRFIELRHKLLRRTMVGG